MIDAFHLPSAQRPEALSIFYARGVSSVATVGAWQVWTKPKWATTINMFCLGSGASGAGGNTRAAGAATIGAGGGGGGCSGYTRLIIPAAFVPDKLFIAVGVGPAGGAANGAGVIGMNSYISAIRGSVVAAGLYLSANTNNPAAPAAAGTTGAAGAAGTIAAITAMQLAYAGQWYAAVSIIGGAGSVGAAAAAAVTAMSSSMLCGGTGGGGTASGVNVDRAGGLIAAVGLVPALAGGVVTGGNGVPGFWNWKGMCGTGGTGGGSNSASGVGGAGGPGAYGCGGGGGGEGVTGGVGGKGGDGLVVITCLD